MCELHPQWVQQEDFARKQESLPTNFTGSQEKIREKMVTPGINCKHIHIIAITSCSVYCSDCRNDFTIC